VRLRKTEAAELLRATFSDAPIGMALVSIDGDDSGCFVQVNGALCELLGYTAAELVGMRFEAITHPDDAVVEAELLARLIGGEVRRYELEMRCVAGDGDVRWLNVHSAIVGSTDGKPVRRVVQLEDITARKRVGEQLQFLADHDPLTGLLNHRRFNEELARHVAAAARYGPGALIALDLDEFKHVNDTLGHAAGDELLIRIAAVLRRRLRSSDVVGRLGGDEFAVILPHATPAQAHAVAEDLLRTIRAESGAAGGIEVSASIGVAVFGGESDEPDDVLLAADLAMYEAKNTGRNQLVATPPEGLARARARSQRGRMIRRALQTNALTLYSQPILDVRSGAPSHHELLLRIAQDGTAVATPAEFLHLAEQLGLIRAIDHWVVTTALELAGRRPPGLGGPLMVNVSGASLGDARLLETIEAAIRSSAVDPAGLVFEITETAAVAHIDAAAAFAQRLGGLGCGLALDDFGEGFGSFFYLKHLSCDYIKIAGAFVRNLVTQPDDRVIVKAIQGIATGLGKKTIAEHVEDAETLRLLAELGVDYAQGFQIGRPRPIEPA
jgi:diguanylate cyclase (GGDEF)-like protein/PAS domain S-box-containing protein